MNNIVFSENLKKLRLQKKLTQEQVADILGVNAHTISRWECGTTLPDVMLLPEIAKIYCVTVDDLYKDNSSAYDNYAQRLADVFMKTRNINDFALAHNEFERLKNSGEYSFEDKRIHGAILIAMLSLCKKQAISNINSIIVEYEKRNDISPENKIYWRARYQKAVYYYNIENCQYICDEQEKQLKRNQNSYMEYAVTIDAFRFCGFYDKAYDYFKIANKKFPNNWEILVNGAEVCKALKKYEEAIKYCDIADTLPQALTHIDHLYAKAFCLEELVKYEQAVIIWKKIITLLENEGYEADFEKKHLQNCINKINK